VGNVGRLWLTRSINPKLVFAKAGIDDGAEAAVRLEPARRCLESDKGVRGRSSVGEGSSSPKGAEGRGSGVAHKAAQAVERHNAPATNAPCMAHVDQAERP